MGQPASLGWSFACPDWWERLKAGKTLVPKLPLDAAEAVRAVTIFNKLRLPDVPGTPLLRDAAGEWQRDIVRVMGGSLMNGTRYVPEIFAMVPKKNSKTTGGAAMTLTALLMNERPRAEFVYVGPVQEVADLAFQQTVGMIEADDTGFLQKRFHVSDHVKTIYDRRNKAKLKIKTFDMKVVVGSKPVFILIDELHMMSGMSQAARIIGQLRGGMLPNPEAMLVVITTQSDEPPSGVFKSELQYARGVRDGRITEGVRMLPILYEFPEDMQTDETKPWADPVNWPYVLPNLNRSITLDRLVSEWKTAVEKGEEEQRRWASQHLNVEIGLALHNDRWRGADFWQKQKAPEGLTLEQLIARCEVIVAGIDGGGLDDLFGLSFAGRDKITKDWLFWFRAWVQPEVFGLRKEIAQKLQDFRNDGDLIVCESTTQDIIEIAELVERVRNTGLLPEKHGVGLDPYAISALVDELDGRDINGDQIVAIRQGAALSPASWGMERKLKDGTLWHPGSPMMAWCVGNARTEQRGNAILITKETAGKAKIDPLVAGFNAAMLLSRNPEAAGTSIYNERGALVL